MSIEEKNPLQKQKDVSMQVYKGHAQVVRYCTEAMNTLPRGSQFRTGWVLAALEFY